MGAAIVWVVQKTTSQERYKRYKEKTISNSRNE